MSDKKTRMTSKIFKSFSQASDLEYVPLLESQNKFFSFLRKEGENCTSFPSQYLKSSKNEGGYMLKKDILLNELINKKQKNNNLKKEEKKKTDKNMKKNQIINTKINLYRSDAFHKNNFLIKNSNISDHHDSNFNEVKDDNKYNISTGKKKNQEQICNRIIYFKKPELIKKFILNKEEEFFDESNAKNKINKKYNDHKKYDRLENLEPINKLNSKKFKLGNISFDTEKNSEIFFSPNFKNIHTRKKKKLEDLNNNNLILSNGNKRNNFTGKSQTSMNFDLNNFIFKNRLENKEDELDKLLSVKNLSNFKLFPDTSHLNKIKSRSVNKKIYDSKNQFSPPKTADIRNNVEPNINKKDIYYIKRFYSSQTKNPINNKYLNNDINKLSSFDINNKKLTENTLSEENSHQANYVIELKKKENNELKNDKNENLFPNDQENFYNILPGYENSTKKDFNDNKQLYHEPFREIIPKKPVFTITSTTNILNMPKKIIDNKHMTNIINPQSTVKIYYSDMTHETNTDQMINTEKNIKTISNLSNKNLDINNYLSNKPKSNTFDKKILSLKRSLVKSTSCSVSMQMMENSNYNMQNTNNNPNNIIINFRISDDRKNSIKSDIYPEKKEILSMKIGNLKENPNSTFRNLSNNNFLDYEDKSKNENNQENLLEENNHALKISKNFFEENNKKNLFIKKPSFSSGGTNLSPNIRGTNFTSNNSLEYNTNNLHHHFNGNINNKNNSELSIENLMNEQEEKYRVRLEKIKEITPSDKRNYGDYSEGSKLSSSRNPLKKSRTFIFNKLDDNPKDIYFRSHAENKISIGVNSKMNNNNSSKSLKFKYFINDGNLKINICKKKVFEKLKIETSKQKNNFLTHKTKTNKNKLIKKNHIDFIFLNNSININNIDNILSKNLKIKNKQLESDNKSPIVKKIEKNNILYETYSTKNNKSMIDFDDNIQKDLLNCAETKHDRKNFSQDFKNRFKNDVLIKYFKNNGKTSFNKNDFNEAKLECKNKKLMSVESSIEKEFIPINPQKDVKIAKINLNMFEFKKKKK